MNFESLNFPPNKTFGLKYGFYLEDAIGEKHWINDNKYQIESVPEYLIIFDELVSIANEYKLKLIEHANFLDFY